MVLCNEIKKLLVDCDITLTQLARIIAEKKGKHYTIQNLSQKLRNNTLNSTEIDIIMEALGYRIIFYPKDI
ncbi:hypothetical protein IJ541_01205 [bacterium]|nr:hypothetical protein [bacterium]